jgi:SWI/SNF-related matrix-associated actin-dependent regulator 1 of chromatin subfamily A
MRVVKLSRIHYGIVSDRFSPALRDACRTVPGMRWNGSAWEGYVDAVDATVRALALKSIRIDAKALPNAGDYGEPAMPVAWLPLRDYQKVGVKFLIAQGPTGALLADSMGLGKSLELITAARAFKEKTLVVCPAHVRGVWARHDKANPGQLQRWWPATKLICTPEGVTPFTPLSKATKAQLVEGATPFWPREVNKRLPSVMAAASVVIVHYDILYAWIDVLIDWDFRTLILDEAHAIQSAKSRRSVAVGRLARHASVVFAATGTPLTNRPADLWNLIETISPGRMGHFFNYGLAFANGHKEEVTKDKIVWKFDGKSNLDELATRLKFFTLRRTLEDVRLELPPKTRQIIDVDIPARKRIGVNASILQSARAMRECLNLAADGKLNPAIELIAEHAAGEHRVVVFTYRRAIAEYVVNAMAGQKIPASVIHGGIPQAQRDVRIREASLLPSHVLAATIDSTSTGIDLSYADVAVFLELTWEPHELAQAEARLHRFGQIKPVLIQYIIARGTGDELVLDAVINKLDTQKALGLLDSGGLKTDLEGAPLNEEEGNGLEALAARLAEMEEAGCCPSQKKTKKRKTRAGY